MSPIRTAILALTAVAAFGAAMASTTTTASAWHKPHWKKWHHYHHGYYRPYYRPYYYAEPVAYSSYRSAPAPRPRVVSAPPQPPVQAQAPAAQNPANCLSKAYTPEGQVVFSDNCTKESAMAPVPNVPQQGSQQLQPQQQSEASAPQQNFAGKSFRKFGNAQQQQPQQQ